MNNINEFVNVAFITNPELHEKFRHLKILTAFKYQDIFYLKVDPNHGYNIMGQLYRDMAPDEMVRPLKTKIEIFE